MIKRLMSRLRQPGKTAQGQSGRAFNGQLLERQREDVYILLHQQLGGLR